MVKEGSATESTPWGNHSLPPVQAQLVRQSPPRSGMETACRSLGGTLEEEGHRLPGNSRPVAENEEELITLPQRGQAAPYGAPTLLLLCDRSRDFDPFPVPIVDRGLLAILPNWCWLSAGKAAARESEAFAIGVLPTPFGDPTRPGPEAHAFEAADRVDPAPDLQEGVLEQILLLRLPKATRAEPATQEAAQIRLGLFPELLQGFWIALSGLEKQGLVGIFAAIPASRFAVESLFVPRLDASSLSTARPGGVSIWWGKARGTSTSDPRGLPTGKDVSSLDSVRAISKQLARDDLDHEAVDLRTESDRAARATTASSGFGGVPV